MTELVQNLVFSKLVKMKNKKKMKKSFKKIKIKF